MSPRRTTLAAAALAAVLATALAGCQATPAQRAENPAPRAPDPPATSATATGPATGTAVPDAAALATTLTDAEAALADPATAEVERDRWARAHQRVHRTLAARPGLRAAVADRLPPGMRPAFALTATATRHLRLLNTPRPELPDWRIVAPPPVPTLRGFYDEAERRFAVPWSVVAAIHFVETRFGRIRGDSHAGAQGPMQFMPRTWEAYGSGDIQDPRDAILAAGRYLAASGAPEDLDGALFAYNRSEHYVRAIRAYAGAMARQEHYLDLYHRWQVYYRTPRADVLLEEGYDGP